MKKTVTGSVDYELISRIKSNKENSKAYICARDELFFKYGALITKMKMNLIGRATKTGLLIDYEVEEYSVFAFDKFLQAVNGIDLDKVTDPEKFLFYIQYFNYLRSMNRDLIAHRIKQLNNELQLISIADAKSPTNINDTFAKDNILEAQESGRTASAEDETMQNLQSAVINKAIDYCLEKKFSSIQKDIFLMKTDNMTLKTIFEELEISGSEYYKEMRAIRSILKTVLKKMSVEDHVDLELSYVN